MTAPNTTSAPNTRSAPNTMSAAQAMMTLIRTLLKGEELPQPFDCDLKEVFSLAKSHDMAHLVADALIKSGQVTKDHPAYDRLQKEKLLAVYREARISAVAEETQALLAGAGIRFIPLKGLVIRRLYPERWMRTSCDIDILIEENDIEKAKKLLENSGFSTDGVYNFHDMAFYKNDVHLELHFSILEDDAQIDGLLKRVWDYAELKDGCEYKQANEYYAFQHVAHASHHFLNGGCGIRPFIDLWVLRKNGYYDEQKLAPLLEEAKLVVFYREAVALSEFWMEGGAQTELTPTVEDFVLRNGVYGTQEENINIGLAKNKNSKIKLLLKTAFPKYSTMACLYPVLKKHRILLPLCYARRFFAKAFGKDRKRIRKRVGDTLKKDPKTATAVGELIKSLGLNQK